MKHLLLASSIVLLSMAANAEPSKHCGASLRVTTTKTCQPQRLAQQERRCSCETVFGTVCSGPCPNGGKPQGCICKPEAASAGLLAKPVAVITATPPRPRAAPRAPLGSSSSVPS